MGLRLSSDCRCIVYVIVLVHFELHHALGDLIFELLFAAFSVRGREITDCCVGHAVLEVASKHAFAFRDRGLDVSLQSGQGR